jgi:hypothetical protein
MVRDASLHAAWSKRTADVNVESRSYLELSKLTDV